MQLWQKFQTEGTEEMQSQYFLGIDVIDDGERLGILSTLTSLSLKSFHK